MTFVKFQKRVLIVLFWVALIFGALYLPHLKLSPFEDRSINVFTWGDMIDNKIIADFEKETGINVHLNYYSSNEELLVKLKATGGEGYDLVLPSDYAVSLLAQEDLLKPLDHSRLTFFKDLNPSLMNHDFDPGNKYSIPYDWEIFGLGIDMDYFKTHPYRPSWDLVFDEKFINYKIAMINDPLQTLLLANLYLYGPPEPLTASKFNAIKELLIRQRSWVEVYADFRADYFLATRVCPVVVATSAYIWRTKRLYPFVKFVVPEEGTYISIENLAIPKPSKKEEMTYAFINYLFRKESVVHHFRTFGFFPSSLKDVDSLDIGEEDKNLVKSSQGQFKKFYFYRTIYPQEQIRDLWVTIKS